MDLSFKDICKSSNEFSFLSTIFDLVGNKQYKSSEYSALIEGKDDESTRIWLSLSAIGQEIGDVFQQNVNNFIDNLLNCDTCGTNGLQSLADMLGINYTIFSITNDFPNDIRKLIDVLSLKKEYLLDIHLINSTFASYLCANCSSYNENHFAELSAQSINVLRTCLCVISDVQSYDELSSLWHTAVSVDNFGKTYHRYCPEIDTRTTLSADALKNTIYDIYYNFIMSKLTMTYNDNLSTMIYHVLSNNIILSNFTLYNDYQTIIDQLKVKYNIRLNFYTSTEADNIDNGISTLDDYSEYEKKLLDYEFAYRHLPYNTLELLTRNKYYKEIEVKEYFDFVKNEYLRYDTTYLSSEKYDVDQEYFILHTDYDNTKSLLSINGAIKTDWISAVVDELTYITENIRYLREQIKMFCLKNFMKGTFLLISYLINEYLKTNTIRNMTKLKSYLPDCFMEEKDPTFDPDSNFCLLTEYIDPIKYFNICANVDIGKFDHTELSDLLNPRYWEVKSTVNAVGAIDTTDVFSIPPTVNANVFAFDIATLSAFYSDIMRQKFKLFGLSKLSASYTDHLSKFLSYIFDVGADSTYKDDSGNLVFDIEDLELSTYKADLYLRYTANKDSEFPFYYYENTYHPSYQIHPYLSSFMEKVDYSYPILNIATITKDSIIDLVKKNLASYIDLYGYLQNLWNNPLGANLDYQTRYELAEHLDLNNYINPILGYDGMFYPNAIVLLSNNQAFANMKEMLLKNLKDDSILEKPLGLKNYYYHLNLNTSERERIHSLLVLFRQLLKDYAFANNDYTIYKYGLDLYQNAYILVKRNTKTIGNKIVELSQQELQDKDGILFIRLRNHPIAFPAYAMYKVDNDYTVDNVYSNLYADTGNSSITNNAIWKTAATTFQIALRSSISYQTPGIKNFNISIDKQNILIVENFKIPSHGNKVCIAIAYIERQHIDMLEMDVLMLSKIDNSTEFLYYNSSNTDYKFACFFNTFNKLAVCMYSKLSNSKIELLGKYYDYSNQQDTIRNIAQKQINLEYPIKADTDIVFDATNDNNLVFSYVTNKKIRSFYNYLGHKFSYSNYEQYLSRPVDNYIVLKAFSVYNTFQEVNIDINSNPNDAALFCSYTDIGFFGLFENKITKNNIVSGTAIELQELKNRGILKFLLLGEKKSKPIDFMQTLPVRVRERYRDVVNVTEINSIGGLTALSVVHYDYAHFGEDVVSAKDESIAAHIEDMKYDPVLVNKILNGNSATLELDEEYHYLLRNVKKHTNILYDNIVVGPYLMLGTIPDRYKCPGSLALTDYVANADTFSINLSANHTSISCSWYLNNTTKDIQLDFNTCYYNRNNYFAGEPNYFNYHRSFLALSKAGDAGYLNTFKENGEYDMTYYIKNISDKYPKFILAVVENINNIRILIDQYRRSIVTLTNNYTIEL